MSRASARSAPMTSAPKPVRVLGAIVGMVALAAAGFALWAGAIYGSVALYHATFGYPRGHVTRGMLGERWPLTVDQGVLHCRNGDLLSVSTLWPDNDQDVNEYELVSNPRPADTIQRIWDERKPLRPLLVRARALCR
jgi:hypothetical protein